MLPIRKILLFMLEILQCLYYQLETRQGSKNEPKATFNHGRQYFPQSIIIGAPIMRYRENCYSKQLSTKSNNEGKHSY